MFLLVQVVRWYHDGFSNADHQEVFHFFGTVGASLMCHDCESRGGPFGRFRVHPLTIVGWTCEKKILGTLLVPSRKLTWQWKIHHEWRCISNWKSGCSINVMLFSWGVIQHHPEYSVFCKISFSRLSYTRSHRSSRQVPQLSLPWRTKAVSEPAGGIWKSPWAFVGSEEVWTKHKEEVLKWRCWMEKSAIFRLEM